MQFTADLIHLTVRACLRRGQETGYNLVKINFNLISPSSRDPSHGVANYEPVLKFPLTWS
jgi:hypothetical protein